MNEEAHIDENMRVARNGGTRVHLSPEELATDRQGARDEYRRLMKVGCTGCGYCMPCPSGVDIPGCFAKYNAHALFPHDLAGKVPVHGPAWGPRWEKNPNAGLCRQCGKCAKACPQPLPDPRPDEGGLAGDGGDDGDYGPGSEGLRLVHRTRPAG